MSSQCPCNVVTMSSQCLTMHSQCLTISCNFIFSAQRGCWRGHRLDSPAWRWGRGWGGGGVLWGRGWTRRLEEELEVLGEKDDMDKYAEEEAMNKAGGALVSLQAHTLMRWMRLGNHKHTFKHHSHCHHFHQRHQKTFKHHHYHHHHHHHQMCQQRMSLLHPKKEMMMIKTQNK